MAKLPPREKTNQENEALGEDTVNSRENISQDEPEQPDGQWQYNGDDTAQSDLPPVPASDVKPVSWTASEFIAHEKSVGWYLILLLATIGTCAVIYLLTEDKTTTGVVVFVALMFGIVASRKPRVLEYEISSSGVRIGEKLYPYQVLKSFSVIQEGAVSSVMLLPLRRFMPSVTMYYPPDQEDVVINALGTHLPQEARKSDAIDRLMHKVRF